jgi:hypothetical protein
MIKNCYTDLPYLHHGIQAEMQEKGKDRKAAKIKTRMKKMKRRLTGFWLMHIYSRRGITTQKTFGLFRLSQGERVKA